MTHNGTARQSTAPASTVHPALTGNIAGNGDRFTMDVLREGFAAISDEMFVSLQRTSQSPIIYEVLDFGVGIADAAGELVSQGNGIAGFLGPLGDAVKEVLARKMELRGAIFCPLGPLRNASCGTVPSG